MRSLLLVCVFFGTGAVAQVPGFGSCPNLPVVKEFDIKKFLGRWFEVEKYFAYFEFGKKCVSLDFTKNPADGSMQLTTKGISKWTKKEKTSVSKLTSDSNDPAKLTLASKNFLYTSYRNYWILDTDHTSYAVIWSCSKVLGFFNAQYAWILSRRRFIPEETRIRIYENLEKLGVKRTKLILTDQSNCPDDQRR